MLRCALPVFVFQCTNLFSDRNYMHWNGKKNARCDCLKVEKKKPKKWALIIISFSSNVKAVLKAENHNKENTRAKSSGQCCYTCFVQVLHCPLAMEIFFENLWLERTDYPIAPESHGLTRSHQTLKGETNFLLVNDCDFFWIAQWVLLLHAQGAMSFPIRR